MSMNDYSNNEQPKKEPLSSKISRFIGVGSSLLVIGGLAYWAYGLGSRDASAVPVISALKGDGEIRTAPEDAGGEEVDYQGNQVNGVLEGNPPALTDDVELAPSPTNLDDVDPAVSTQTTTIEIPVETVSDVENLENEIVILDSNLAPVPSPERRPELLYIPPKDQMNPLTREARPVGSLSGESLPVEVTPASEIVEPLPDISTPSLQEANETEAVVEALNAITETSSVDELGPRLSSGTPLIQLAANTALEDTQSQWKKIQAENVELLGSKSLYVETTTVNDKLYYRLRVSGFADDAEAQEACKTLLARNMQCLFVRAK